MKIKQDKTSQEVFRDKNFIQGYDKFAIRKKTHTIFLCVGNPHNKVFHFCPENGKIDNFKGCFVTFKTLLIGEKVSVMQDVHIMAGLGVNGLSHRVQYTCNPLW